MTVTESFLQVEKQLGATVAVSLLSLVGLAIGSWRLLAKRDALVLSMNVDHAEAIKKLNGKHATAVKELTDDHAKQLVDALAAKDAALTAKDVTIASKELEIQRLNSERLSEVQGHGSQMVTVARESTQLVAETNQTLSTVAGAMKEWRDEQKNLKVEVNGMAGEMRVLSSALK